MQAVGRERGAIGRFLTTTLVVVLILGLLGAVGYLLSDLNHRRYRINVRDGHMWVERGLFLPLGYVAYAPETPALKDAYAPIAVPLSETVTPMQRNASTVCLASGRTTSASERAHASVLSIATKMTVRPSVS